MGQWRDGVVRAFQQRAGLTPARGERAEVLNRMSSLAFELIKVIELEKSGIRDGDGHWGGCDPIGGIVHDLATLERDELGFT